MNVNPFSYLIEKLKDYTADKIPFNNTGTSLSSTNVEDAIKEIAPIGTMEQLLSARPTVANVFQNMTLSKSLSNFKSVLIIGRQGGDCFVSHYEPIAFFETHTDSANKISLYQGSTKRAEIYYVDDTHIALSMADISNGHAIIIYGIY